MYNISTKRIGEYAHYGKEDIKPALLMPRHIYWPVADILS
jgi:hypothetical protein